MNNFIAPSIDPILYDIFNNKCTADIPMYAKICKNADTILELGIGTGRIALPLAELGIKIVGVDNSLPMINKLQEKIQKQKIKNIIVLKQDMRNLALNQIFDYVICPFCTFNFLLSLEDQENTLKTLHPYLSSKSKIVFDLMTPYTFSYVMQDCDNIYFDTYINSEYKIDIYIKSTFDQSCQLFTQERLFRFFHNNVYQETKKAIMHNRIFLLGEFELLLKKNGYKIVDVYGDYNFAKFTSASKNLIVMAAKM